MGRLDTAAAASKPCELPNSSWEWEQDEQVKWDMFRRKPMIYAERFCHFSPHAVEERAYGNIDFLKHADALSCIHQRDVLWSRDNHRAYMSLTFSIGVGEIQKNLPSTTTSCPRLSCTSPVPGGMSITRTSRSSSSLVQSTSNSS